MVLRSLYELGQFDDIIQATDRVKPESSVGLVFANAADVWNDAAEYGCVGTPPCDYQGPWGAAKRSLYIALKHIQITDIDMLLDDDVQDPQLMAQYSTVYVVDPHMGTNTSIALAQWVEAGGSLWASATAGSLSEANAPNLPFRALLGLPSQALPVQKAALIKHLKNELPAAGALETVTLQDGRTVQAFGAVHVTNVTGPNTTVLARFSGGGSACFTRKVGKGHAYYCGFLP